MRTPCLICFAVVLLAGRGFASAPYARESDYQPELFKKTKLVYADTFDGPLN